MKKNLFIMCFLLLGLLWIAPLHVQAQTTTKRECIGKDLYCVTTIEEKMSTTKQTIFMATVSSKINTKTASKTVTYENSNGDKLWYVKVTGTFRYNGSTSTCTASTVTAGSYSSNWRISNKTSSKTNNTASASAKGTQYLLSKVIFSATRTVTLSCSKSGNLS